MLTTEANDLHRVILFEPGQAIFPSPLLHWVQNESRVRYVQAFIVDRIEGSEASWNILRAQVCLSLELGASGRVMVSPRPLWRCTPADRFLVVAMAQPGELGRVYAHCKENKYGPILPERVVVGFAIASTEEQIRFS